MLVTINTTSGPIKLDRTRPGFYVRHDLDGIETHICYQYQPEEGEPIWLTYRRDVEGTEDVNLGGASTLREAASYIVDEVARTNAADRARYAAPVAPEQEAELKLYRVEIRYPDGSKVTSRCGERWALSVDDAIARATAGLPGDRYGSTVQRVAN